MRLPMGDLAGREVRVEILHPAHPWTAASALWDGDGLRVSLPRTPSVLLVRLRA
jgi:alpha-galactosidase